MKKILYLGALLFLPFFALKAQEKDKETRKGIENFRKDGPIDKEMPNDDFTSSDPGHVYSLSGLQVHPSFPGSFQAEVQKGLNTADNGAPSSFNARTYVSFIIEKDGSLSNVTFTRDPGYGFGQEVVDAVKNVKVKWQPGIMHDKPVRVKYVLPVIIKVP